MADLLNIQAKTYQNGNVSQDWISLTEKSTSLAAGYRWMSSNFVMCLKIELPMPAKSLSFSFCNASGGMTADQTMRYKFTQNEDVSLINATSEIQGDGSFVLKHGATVRNTVTIERVFLAGTHYLYIWTNNSNVTYNVMYVRWEGTGDYRFIGGYEPLGGFIWIKDSVGVRPYNVYVKTVNGPVLLMPYIKTADGPKLLC